MEKRLIATMVAAAFAGTTGVAIAGPISVASIGTYAAETIGGATGNITLGNVAYTLSSPFAIASTQTLEYILGSGAKMATCPTVGIIDSITAAAPVGVTVGAATKSGSSCKYTVTTTTNAVPGNSLVNFTLAAADKTAGAILSSGGSLTATVNVYNSLGAQVEGNTATVASAAQALTAAWVSSGTAVASTVFATAEKSKVDVTANPVATAFTDPNDVTFSSTTYIVLGAFQLKNAAGTYLDSDGTTAVNIAALTTNKQSLTVTGPFVSNTKADVVFASSTADCDSYLDGFALAGNTATLTLDAVDAGLDTASPQSVFVCYEPEAGLAAGKEVQIPTGQFNGSATVATATAVTPTGMLPEGPVTGALYNLGSNGAAIDVRVMTTAATTGWSTVLRLINTGSIPAPVTATYLLADGTTGASGQIVASLPAGGTAMISSAQVEAALGVTLAASGNPPRIRISAPTNSLVAQAWVQSPNGAWFMGTPGMEDDANAFKDYPYYNITPQ
jgi:hypothetical protein